ncbi:MAG: hypothetical protein LGR52_04255, partial [Candidatus Thiosymbion ectosymbiont of Robbea hypermnestra]|nr:hypothetical protein [Candidatus Thiosymbion ectosymbiont of Robbea hypermnestra]
MGKANARQAGLEFQASPGVLRASAACRTHEAPRAHQSVPGDPFLQERNNRSHTTDQPAGWVRKPTPTSHSSSFVPLFNSTGFTGFLRMNRIFLRSRGRSQLTESPENQMQQTHT